MRSTSARAGLTLVELLVAVVLVLLVIGVAGTATQRLLTEQSRSATTDTRRAALTDALLTLARQVQSADPASGDLHSAADSVLELVHDIGMTTVCRASGDTLVVTSGADSAAWASTLPRAITADDRVRIWHDADERWVERHVRTASSATGPCGDSSSAWPDRATQQLVLDGTTDGLRPGVVTRVLQQERWSMVRGSDGNWSLSLATWDAARAAYTTPQPLLAPLATPTARIGPGFSVRATGADGRRLADVDLDQTRAIAITLRMAAAPRLPTIADSVRIHVSTH